MRYTVQPNPVSHAALPPGEHTYLRFTIRVIIIFIIIITVIIIIIIIIIVIAVFDIFRKGNTGFIYFLRGYINVCVCVCCQYPPQRHRSQSKRSLAPLDHQHVSPSFTNTTPEPHITSSHLTYTNPAPPCPAPSCPALPCPATRPTERVRGKRGETAGKQGSCSGNGRCTTL